MKASFSFLLIVSIMVLCLSCEKEETITCSAPIIAEIPELDLPQTPFDYGSSNYPAHLLQALSVHDNTPADNPITNHGATLGRVLFYDKNLSINNAVSCASCHHQDKGFTDGTQLSEGFNGQLTRRNAMSLLNLRMYDREKMFWDERANNLEEQVLHPIQDPIEMGLSIPELLLKLDTVAYYKPLFFNAFGDSVISENRIAKALSQFLRSIVTYQSKFDRVIAGTASFTTEEFNGQVLYNTVGSQQGCVSCHGGDLIDQHSYNFQIGQVPSNVNVHDLNDLGIFEITQNPNDSSRFKISSLRNIELTAPYLHNGSVPNLQALFAPNSPHNFGMTQNEINDLISFLKTLTDHTIQYEEKFSNPF